MSAFACWYNITNLLSILWRCIQNLHQHFMFCKNVDMFFCDKSYLSDVVNNSGPYMMKSNLLKRHFHFFWGVQNDAKHFPLFFFHFSRMCKVWEHSNFQMFFWQILTSTLLLPDCLHGTKLDFFNLWAHSGSDQLSLWDFFHWQWCLWTVWEPT